MIFLIESYILDHGLLGTLRVAFTLDLTSKNYLGNFNFMNRKILRCSFSFSRLPFTWCYEYFNFVLH